MPTQLERQPLEMSPHHLAALGLSWSPAQGFFASGELNYVGSRYLNKRNTALAESYSTLAALVGWRHGRYEVRLSGRNLTDSATRSRRASSATRSTTGSSRATSSWRGPSASSRRYGATCSSTAKSPGFQAWAMT